MGLRHPCDLRGTSVTTENESGPKRSKRHSQPAEETEQWKSVGKCQRPRGQGEPQGPVKGQIGFKVHFCLLQCDTRGSAHMLALTELAGMKEARLLGALRSSQRCELKEGMNAWS